MDVQNAPQAQRTFLDLPPELRNQIYDIAIQPVRLRRLPIQDPDYLISTGGFYSKIPHLMFTCRQIYHETIAMFYAKATLTIESCQQSASDGRSRSQYYGQHEIDYAFCPRELLQQIRTVHVHSNALWPVDQDAFQALFSWLISNTAVNSMWFSRKVMQQWRHIEKMFDLNDMIYPASSDPDRIRAVDIFARRICPRLRIYRSANILLEASMQKSLEIQAYQTGHGDDANQLRLDREKSFFNGDRGCIRKRDRVTRNHGRVAGKYFSDPFMRSAYRNDFLGLYQSILIQ